MSTVVGVNQMTQVGKACSFTAGDSFSITVGKSSLVMKKDGTISINGKDIDLVGEAHIGLDSKRIDLN